MKAECIKCKEIEDILRIITVLLAINVKNPLDLFLHFESQLLNGARSQVF